MTFSQLDQLFDFLQLSDEQIAELAADTPKQFPLKVPRHFAEQIEKSNPQDPLLLQILPRKVEKRLVVGFQPDPVGDLNANPIPSLLHKYHGRALLMTSPRCDLHCRYCFRRHFPYEQVKQPHWQAAITQIQADESIQEIILSGGDPMTLSEPQLIQLMQQLAQIPHLHTLRIHSRTPVAAPDQAPQKAFLEFCQQTHLKIVLVVHCNHANELSNETAKLFDTYRQAGITLLNQSVLLKGINNEAETLIKLSHRLFQQGILPYYLHQLDRVAGAAHFEVEDNQAAQLMHQIRQKLPGYLVPKLVREIAGKPYKMPLA